MDAELIGDTLEALADADTAKRHGKQHRPLRGVRGTPLGEVARVGAACWAEAPPSLPDDAGELSALFAAAWEDGLVAIGLLAAALPDRPEAALALGREWLGLVDDVATADALGWLVLGGGVLATGGGLADLGKPSHPVARRAVVMAGLAALPESFEGPAAAPLRARLGERHVQWVDAPRSDELRAHCDNWLRDEAPAVRKALQRILRTWTRTDAPAVAAWGESVRGGLPKLLRAEVQRAARFAAKAAR